MNQSHFLSPFVFHNVQMKTFFCYMLIFELISLLFFGQNESLRIYQGEIEENNACLLQKLSACQRQLSQVEKCCHQKLDCMNRELEDLNSKLADREDQIAQCKECLNLKVNKLIEHPHCRSQSALNLNQLGRKALMS